MTTIAAGAFVAGLDAGLAYNTFPLMDGQWVPPGYLDQAPWWRNHLENTASVQFNHRLLATVTAVAIIANWFPCAPTCGGGRGVGRRWRPSPLSSPWRGGDFGGRAGRCRPSPIDGDDFVRGHGDLDSWPYPTGARLGGAPAPRYPTTGGG